MQPETTPGNAALSPQPFRHQVELVKAWCCVDCGELFYPDWPLDDVPCPAHEKGSAHD